MKQEIDIELIKRFDKAGPRYTSYPTAPCFKEDYGAAEFAEDLQAEPADQALSLYVHLPYCHTLCYFCACNMRVSNDQAKISEYLEVLKADIALTASHLNHQPLKQVHWGGGTPTHLRPEQMRQVMADITDHFSLAEDAEISLEIDPRRLDEQHLDAIAAAGFNRASMGVQDTNPQVQTAINRIQPPEMNAWAFEGLRQRGLKSLNADLIYGLPFQTPESIDQSLEDVLALSPDRLAIFNFAMVPWKVKHQQVLTQYPMPSPDEKLLMLEKINDRLHDAGYHYVGMDHFAKPEDSLVKAQQEGSLRRNFQGYSTLQELSIVGVGSSSISQLSGAYAQNLTPIKDYKARIRNGQGATHRGLRLSADDQLRRQIIMTLMCHFKISFDDFADQIPGNQSFADYFAAELEELHSLAALGLLECDQKGLAVSNAGRMVIRNVAMVFDAWLKKMNSKQPLFSPHRLMPACQTLVVGGGPAGLAAACHLKLKQQDVQLLEAGPRVGGKVQSSHQDGRIYEWGPATSRFSPEAQALLESLNLLDQVQAPEHNRRFILDQQSLVKVPSLSMFKPGGLLGPRALLWPWQELFTSSAPASETVHDFFKRHKGQKILDNLFAPFVSGVYAGDVKHLLVEEAFPKLKALEQSGQSSLLIGALRRLRQGKAKKKTYFSGSVSFKGGMQSLTDRMAQFLEGQISLNSAAAKLAIENQSVRVILENGQEWQAEKLVLALPPNALAKVLRSLDSNLSDALDGIPQPTVASVYLHYAKVQCPQLPAGFGFLVPPRLKRKILGCLFMSSMFPHHAPESEMSLRVFMGGMLGQDQLNAKNEHDLAATAHQELTDLALVTGEAMAHKVMLIDQAIPQCGKEAAAAWHKLRDFKKAHPSIRFATYGNQGISLGDAIDKGLVSVSVD